MRFALVVSVLAAAVALTVPGEALATDECKGLDVCISVPGPWVAVPGSPTGRLTTVEYQLTCPRGSIVGGLDAVYADRSLLVRFLGKLGSPVNPGISTERSVIFQVSTARRAPTALRPLVGCIPTSGGGGRSTTAVRPSQPRPPARLVRSVRVRTVGGGSLAFACRSGERLVGSSYAVAFRAQRVPTAAALAGVVVTKREQRNRVVVRAHRTGAVPPRANVEVQVHILCAKGRA
jgi:hypothetical protein